jgi:hypothetical protein
MQRSTGDLLILMIAGTICLMLLGTVTAVIIIQAVNPDADVLRAVTNLTNVVNTMVGMLAGYLAGKTQRRQEKDDDGGHGPADR